MCHVTTVTANSEIRVHVVERNATRFQSKEDTRERGLTRIVPSVNDIEPLKILDGITRILNAFLPNENHTTTEITDINLIEHEHFVAAGS